MSDLKNSILWITDPWDKLNHPTESTLRLAQASLALGIPSYWSDVRSIHAIASQGVFLTIKSFESFGADRKVDSIRLGEARVVRASSFKTVIYRPDPPVNQSYRFPLQLLRMESKSTGMKILNPAEVLLADSEKLLGYLQRDLFPETWIGSQLESLKKFGIQQGLTVMKPLNDARARGVELLDWTSPSKIAESAQQVEVATVGFTIPIVLQHYYSEIQTQGETRLWFVNGKVIGSARKIPVMGEFKFCSLEGGRVEAHEPTPAEQNTAARISQILKDNHICMAAVDLVQGKVTDFNFTSPGLITEMERVSGKELAPQIVLGVQAHSK